MDLINKYRPEDFDKVIGQDAAVRSIEAVLRDKSAHQFCFTGPSGVGKTTLARIIATKVGCSPGQLLEIDAATHTGVDDMRAVTESTAYPGLGDSPVRAIIVDECHRLSKQAWESTLKSLEEPPEYVYWFLCTTEPTKVPPTVLTRCARYDLKPVPRSDIYELLGHVHDAEQLSMSDDVLWFLAGKAEGSPRRALAFLAQCVDVKNEGEAADILAVAGDETGIIELCRFLLDGRGAWHEAAKLINPLRDMGGEAARVVIAAYLTKVLLGDGTSDGQAARILSVLEHFSEPFAAWDSLTPLVVAVGRALYVRRD